MKKRILSIVMIFALAFSLNFVVGTKNASAGAISAEQMSAKFGELKRLYPEGSYWNKSYNNLSWECMGWAETVCDYLFGENPRNWAQQTNWDNMCVGDHVRINNNSHSIVITNMVGNTIYYADCNWNYDGIVHWDKTMSRSELISKATWFKSQPDNWVRTLNPNPPPTTDNFRISNANGDGFTVSANLGGGVTSVWLNIYGPGGSNGYRVSASSGNFSHYIKYSDYGGYGKYSVHLYAENGSGDQAAQSINNIYPSADLGNEFIGIILNKECWKPIQVDNDNYIRLATESGAARQVWKFVHESNGYYKIISAETGKVLDVETAGDENGLSIHTYEDVSGKNQRWALLEQNGGYLLHPCHSTNRVLDLNGNNTNDGSKIQIWDKNNSSAQIFAIYKGDEVQLKASSLTAQAGISSGYTTFDWSNVYGAKRYDIKIWNGTYWVGDPYHIEWGASKPYSIKLPAGHYEAYIDATNEVKTVMSNVVKFDVAEDSSGINIFSHKTVTETGYNIHADIKYLTQSAVYAAALYSAEGKLLDVQTANVESGATSVDVVFAKQTGAAYFKVFLWDDIKSMRPLTESEKFNV